MANETEWTVRPVAASDQAGWRALYRGYRRFYGEPEDEGSVGVLWDWLHGPDGVLTCFVAVDAAGRVGGLAHVRPFPDPLGPSTGLHLDDLYVDPDLRGRGLGRMLLRFVKRYALEQGHYVVRWITAPDNAAARALYDAEAVVTPWVTYDMTPLGQDSP